ncbi:hypothetical protein HY993_03045, partial [Candidatus Micrarchaeota archaeon]|nr:hypothetical protein [Candidatus Micrarchaeota archaeon]
KCTQSGQTNEILKTAWAREKPSTIIKQNQNLLLPLPLFPATKLNPYKKTNFKTDFAALKEEQEKILSQIKADKATRHLFKVAQDILFLKGFRKEALYRGCFAAEPLYKEIAARLSLTLRQARFLTKEEIVCALEGKLSAHECAQHANKRFKLSVCVYALEGEKEYLESDGQKELEKLNVKKLDLSMTTLTGQCAFAGKLIGIAKIVNAPQDIAKVNEGDIMVSSATSPNLLPAMQKAAAFVTDIGGITCHAAIVSREMKKPCVIGTKVATKVFVDGDKLELDAENGIVKKIS